jgi:autotransporter-associated beta strand protein
MTGGIITNGTLFSSSEMAAQAGVISAALAGAGGLTKTGSGTLILSGANTYSGGTAVNAGTLQLSGAGTLGSTAGALTVNGGALDLGGTAQTQNGGLTMTGGIIANGTLSSSSDFAVQAGAISAILAGSGGLTKTGSGTLALAGINTYAGATRVNQGTLMAGTVNAFASASSFSVVAGATLDLANFNQTIGSLAGAGKVTLGTATLVTGSDNTSTAFSGVISGNGGLTKTGRGAFTLAGISTYAGATMVDGGTLAVNGSILASSGVTVNADGTLGGNGVVGNTVINGGTLSPGNSIGLLTVEGNLSFTATSNYLVEVSPSNADRTNVTGTAALGGATVNASFGAGSYVSRQYTILNAIGGVSGRFGSLVNTNLPSNFHTTLSYDANDVYLNLVLNFAVPGGLNGNQQNVGNALTGYFNANGGIPLVYGALTPANLTQASGETATGSQQATFSAMSQFLGVMTDPLIAGRGGLAGAGGGANADAGESMAYAGSKQERSRGERDAYAAVETKAPPVAPDFTQRWSVWASGFGGAQTTAGNAAAGSNDSRSSLYGTAVGADYRVSRDTLAGFALAGGGTNFSVNGLGAGRSDLFQAGAYMRHSHGPAYVSVALAYGWQDVTTERTVAIAGIERLRAGFNANAWSGRGEGGYRFVAPLMGGVGLTPYAAGQFTTFNLPAYAESVVSGAGTFTLAYAAKSITDTRSELGLRTDKSFAMADGIVTLRGRLAWAHDFNPDRSIAATFQALPGASFIVNGAAQAADSALVTASAENKWLNGWSAAATFEGEFSNVTHSYAGKGVVRYQW